jgi:hypothetical protein
MADHGLSLNVEESFPDSTPRLIDPGGPNNSVEVDVVVVDGGPEVRLVMIGGRPRRCWIQRSQEVRGGSQGDEGGKRLGKRSGFSSAVRRDCATINKCFGTGNVGAKWLELHQWLGTGKARLKEAVMNHATPSEACSWFTDHYHYLLSTDECNAEHCREMTSSKQDPIQTGL